MSWDHSADFLAIGSDGARMTAALRAHDLGAETLIVEKASLFGGTTPLSGGVIWVPNNSCMKDLGIADSNDDGIKYLETIINDSSTPQELRTYGLAAGQKRQGRHIDLGGCPRMPFEFASGLMPTPSARDPEVPNSVSRPKK